MGREALEQTLWYIKNTPTQQLIDAFSQKSIISQKKNSRVFRKKYLEYFAKRHDFKRYVWHSLMDGVFWKKSLERAFYGICEPAIYCSDDGRWPSFYNAICGLKENIDRISAIEFDDEKSYDIFNSIINFRLTGNRLLLFDCYEPNEQEYFDDVYVVPWARSKEKACCVDMGAYDGDTALKMNRYFAYANILAYEPDKNNYLKLVKNCSRYKNISCTMQAVGEQKGTVSLDGAGDGVHVDNKESDLSRMVEVVAIDEEIKHTVDFLKLDVEGCELAALKGSKNHIVNDRPVLAIAMYHKLEDIYEIYEYLNSIVQGYCYVYRRYWPDFTAIMYALPKEKICKS